MIVFQIYRSDLSDESLQAYIGKLLILLLHLKFFTKPTSLFENTIAPENATFFFRFYNTHADRVSYTHCD